jgi:hypothetical protein
VFNSIADYLVPDFDAEGVTYARRASETLIYLGPLNLRGDPAKGEAWGMTPADFRAFIREMDRHPRVRDRIEYLSPRGRTMIDQYLRALDELERSRRPEEAAA